MEVNGGCVSLTDICTTLMLLLLTVTHHIPSKALRVISYFIFNYSMKNVSEEVTEMEGRGRNTDTVVGRQETVIDCY